MAKTQLHEIAKNSKMSAREKVAAAQKLFMGMRLDAQEKWVNEQDDEGKTAAHHVGEQDHAFVSLLSMRKANFDILDNDGLPALQAQVLMEKIANAISVKDNSEPLPSKMPTKAKARPTNSGKGSSTCTML